MDLFPSEVLQYCTVKIRADSVEGISEGTAFFFLFNMGDGQHIPVLVTNKHVIRGCSAFALLSHQMGPNREPVAGPGIPWTFPEGENAWIPHPNENIDLAIFPVGGPRKFFSVKVSG